eukprot:scaffold20398_cov184-Amphora_coffeaeformis.AAC.6
MVLPIRASLHRANADPNDRSYGLGGSQPWALSVSHIENRWFAREFYRTFMQTALWLKPPLVYGFHSRPSMQGRDKHMVQFVLHQMYRLVALNIRPLGTFPIR